MIEKLAHSLHRHFVSHGIAHTRTHLPFVLCLTQKWARWSALIKCSQSPCPLRFREKKRNFSFSFILCFWLFPKPFIFIRLFPEDKKPQLQRYKLQPTDDKQKQHLCCALDTTSALQAETRWLGEALANTKTGILSFLFFSTNETCKGSITLAQTDTGQNDSLIN